MKLCKDCKYFEGSIKTTMHRCVAPQNLSSVSLVTGVTVPRKTPEHMRSVWNSGEWQDCGFEGAWWVARG